VPFSILETGDTPELRIVFTACEGLKYQQDNIRFPNNAGLDFEGDSLNLYHSPGLCQVTVQPMGPGGNHGLYLHLAGEHITSDTLLIEWPEATYPLVPDSVGLTIQANSSIDFRNYFQLSSLTRYTPSNPGWNERTVVATMSGLSQSGDTAYYTRRRWSYPNSTGSAVLLLE